MSEEKQVQNVETRFNALIADVEMRGDPENKSVQRDLRLALGSDGKFDFDVFYNNEITTGSYVEVTLRKITREESRKPSV